MDRLKLDQTGARRGQLFRHSLQMGDDTVSIENIATMAIEHEQFMPYRTEKNRQTTGLWTGLGLVALFISMISFAIAAGGGGFFSIANLIAWLSLIATGACGWFAVQLVLAMRKVETFHRLRIGAADGRLIDLVDDNREVLEKIRDTIRMKIDTEDSETVGTFDLDTDTVTLAGEEIEIQRAPPVETEAPAVAEPAAPEEASSLAEPSAPDPYAEVGPEFEPEDEVVLGEDEDQALEARLSSLLKGDAGN